MGGTDEPQPVMMAVTKPKRRGLMPPEVMELMAPSFKFGAWSGVTGAVVGVGGCIAKDLNPVIGGISNGLGFFVAGSGYWLTRTVAMKALGNEDIKPFHKTMVSAGAGTTSGALLGLIRGPSHIVPSMIFWGAMGGVGQIVANRVVAYEPKVKDENDSWLRSKWSPLRKITDDEYIDMMEEKKFKVDVDIALIDDRIAELQAAHPGLKAADTTDFKSTK